MRDEKSGLAGLLEKERPAGIGKSKAQGTSPSLLPRNQGGERGRNTRIPPLRWRTSRRVKETKEKTPRGTKKRSTSRTKGVDDAAGTGPKRKKRRGGRKGSRSKEGSRGCKKVETTESEKEVVRTRGPGPSRIGLTTKTT